MIKIKYRRAIIKVNAKRRKTCEICGRQGKIDFHHTKYAYKTSEVRKNPQLALENTLQLCYPCHKIADAIRIILSNPEITLKILMEVDYAIEPRRKEILCLFGKESSRG
ncbi:MAG: hypothetical protein ACTSUF_03685 [Candidatus Heimdallarchaeaceae archaeon]